MKTVAARAEKTERGERRDASSDPKGWPRVPLGELAEYINGRGFKPKEWARSGLPIVRIKNLTDHSAPFDYFSGDAAPAHRVDSGDLVVSWSASLDAFIWDRGPAVVNQHIFKVVEDAGRVSRQYLYFALRIAMAEIGKMVHGATMKHVTKPVFEAFEVPLPPLAEQERIAGRLTEQLAAVERARAAAQARLAAAEALPAAYLREVFEGPEAREWDSRRLGTVCDLLPSKSIASDGDTQVRAITTACLTERGFRASGVKSARMLAADVPLCMARHGEILIARSNTPNLVGRASIYLGEPEGLVASDLTIRLLAHGDAGGAEPVYLAAYMSYLFQTGYWKARAGGASGSMKKITREQVSAAEVPVPPVATQRRIAADLASRLTAAERVVEGIRAELAAIEAVPAAVLRDAFGAGCGSL